jgi:hypothetical protein
MPQQSPSIGAHPWTCQVCGKENRANRSFCWNCEAAEGTLPTTLPEEPKAHSQPAEALEPEPTLAESPPPSAEMVPEETAAKIDLKAALQAGLIGAAARYVAYPLSLLLIPLPFVSFVCFPLIAIIVILPWLITVATGAFYVYMVRRKCEAVGIGAGALGAAVAGGIASLAGSALGLVLSRV